MLGYTEADLTRARFQEINNPDDLAADLGLQVKLSIGIAYFDPESDDTDDTFLKKAGDALYKVKQGGRNSFLISV